MRKDGHKPKGKNMMKERENVKKRKVAPAI